MYLEEYHVALYMRVSKEDEQNGQSQSIQNQESLLQEFVQQNHLTVYDIYMDDGWSGTHFDRPQFQRMLSDIESKKVNMVITKDLSRLGRDYIMIGHYMERYFPEHHVRYISLLDGIDTGIESATNDITPFRAILNDMYAKDISNKIKSVKRDKQRKGQFIGGKAVYGYKMHPTEKNKIIIDEAVAPMVQHIFSMALSGMSCRQIAISLNEQGISTPATYAHLSITKHGPYTGLWSSERISDMLHNETYIGNMVQGRRMKLNYKSKKCIKQKREHWVIVKGTHTPIIDQKTFDAVQMILQSRKHTRSRTYDFLLKGIIFCHECGYPLAVLNRKNAAGADVLYFVCRTYQRFTKAGVCTCHSIKEQTVTDAVLAQVREICMDALEPQSLFFIAKSILEQTNQKDEISSELQSIQTKIDQITEYIDQLYKDRLHGLLIEEDFQRIYHNVKQEREILKKQKRMLELQQKQSDQIEETATELVQEFINSFYTNRTILVQLIERVELTTEKQIIIKFRFAKPKNH